MATKKSNKKTKKVSKKKGTDKNTDKSKTIKSKTSEKNEEVVSNANVMQRYNEALQKKKGVEKPKSVYKLTEQGSVSIAGMEVYRTDEENYEPYVSPYNEASNVVSDDEKSNNGVDSDTDDDTTDGDDKKNTDKKNKSNKSNKKNNNSTKTTDNQANPTVSTDSDDATTTGGASQQVVLGCDINQGNDSEVQSYIAKRLEEAGHKVEKLAIAPGPFASYSYGQGGKQPEGKVGVYIMADSLVSVADLAFGGTKFKYGYFVIRGDLGRPKMDSREDFENNPIGRDSDCTSICDKIAGKTYKEMNSICKDKCQIVFGTTKEEMADELLKAMGGGSSESKKASEGGTIKEALQKLLTHWDGEVECYIRGDYVHVNKVRNPEEYHSSVLQEGANIVNDSVTVTDINPTTVNKLIVTWTDGTITLTDEKLIERFGEVPKEMEAVKKIIQEVEVPVEDSSSDSSSGDSDSGGSDGGGSDGGDYSSGGDDGGTKFVLGNATGSGLSNVNFIKPPTRLI